MRSARWFLLIYASSLLVLGAITGLLKWGMSFL